MKQVTILFLGVIAAVAECGPYLRAYNPNSYNLKGSEVVGAKQKLPKRLQLTRRDASVNQEQCERCKTSKLCSRNIDLCPLCKRICDSVVSAPNPDGNQLTTTTEQPIDNDLMIGAAPELVTDPTLPLPDEIVSARFGQEFKIENNNRYITVGSIGPGPTMNFLGRLFEIPDAQLPEIEKLVILAQPKIAEASTQPLIFDSARALLNKQNSTPMIFGLGDEKKAKMELAQEINRELDRAIQNKRILLHHDNFTKPELERIIQEVMQQMNTRDSGRPEDEVACSLEETAIVQPIKPLLPPIIQPGYDMERSPEPQRVNPPIRKDTFMVGAPEEQQENSQQLDQRIADPSTILGEFRETPPETVTLSTEIRSQPESDNHLNEIDAENNAQLGSERQELDPNKQTDGLFEQPNVRTSKNPLGLNSKQNVAKDILNIIDDGLNLPSRPLSEARSSENDLSRGIVNLVEDGLQIPEIISPTTKTMLSESKTNDLEDEVAKIVEDSLKIASNNVVGNPETEQFAPLEPELIVESSRESPAAAMGTNRIRTIDLPVDNSQNNVWASLPKEKDPNNLGSFGTLVPINPQNVDRKLPYEKVRFVGKDINLPLKMYRDENGAYQLRVDVDEFCNCKNATCTRRHLDDENFLENSVSQTILPELQVRYNRENDFTDDTRKVGKRSVENNVIEKEKTHPGTPIKDIMKFYKDEEILERKLHELDNSVKVFMQENENLLNRGTVALARHFQTEKNVEEAADLVTRVLAWMQTIINTSN